MPPKKPEKQRGRPKQTRPETEDALKTEVLDACVTIICDLYVLDGLPRDADVSREKMHRIACATIDQLFNAPLLSGLRRTQELEFARLQIVVALQAFARVEHLLEEHPFHDGKEYLDSLGEPLPVSPQAWHDLRGLSVYLGPALRSLNPECFTEEGWKKLISDRFTRAPIEDTRRFMIEHLMDPNGGRKIANFLRSGQEITLRTMAAMSILFGNWPPLCVGEDTAVAVLANEEKKLEQLCKKLGITPPPRGQRGRPNSSSKGDQL
jgi:hypothetical protein